MLIRAAMDSEETVPPQPELLLFSLRGVRKLLLVNLLRQACVLVGFAICDCAACEVDVDALDFPMPSSSAVMVVELTL